MRKLQHFLCMVSLSFLQGSCGCDLANFECASLVECDKTTEVEESGQCVKKTPDERAMIALNDSEYDLAVTLLETLVAEEPTEYFRYPRLASAYAGQAGFDIFNVTNFAASGGGGLQESINTFIPTPDPNNLESYSLQVEKMGQAKDQLLAMPQAERTAGETLYGASASLQLTLYQTAFSVMYLNQFAVPTSTGELDMSRLESLTNNDAAVIIANLESAALEQGDEQVSSQISEALSQIEGQEGSNSREKLIAYIEESEQ